MGFTNYITQIKDTAVPAVTHDLVDTSASHYVKGTQTAATNVWTGALPDGVTAYYDGLSIDYFLPYAGTSTAATLNLGGKGAKPVYIGNGTSGVTTHFPQYSVIHLTYIINSALNSGNGCWKASSYYYANQNVFGKVTVGSTTIEADTTRDTLTLVAGSNITLTPDASNDKVTIAASSLVAQELTQAQYDALTTAQKNSETVYFINDEGLDSEYTIISDSVPIGAIQSYAGSTAPYGWLICDGSAVSRTTYSQLFAVIGTTYGSGNGSSTFNVPDLRGRVVIGESTSYARGTSGGSATHDHLYALQYGGYYYDVALESNTNAGVINYRTNQPVNGVVVASGTTAPLNSSNTAASVSRTMALYKTEGYSGSTSSMQPYTVTNYIIKALDHAIDYSHITQLNASQLALSLVYPVGSYYETDVASFNPATQWGGTWTKETIIDDRLVAEGISGIWHWRKWSDGRSECWGTHSSTSSHYAGPYGTNFYGYTYANLAFPSNLFYSGYRPYAVYNVKVGSAFAMAASNLSVTNTGMNLYALSAISGSQTILWDIHVKGLWKTYAAAPTLYRWKRTA